MQSDAYREELHELLKQRNGTRYCKVDLHVHSPASSDAEWGNLNAFQFIDQFEERGFDLIAVTDHNTGAWIDELVGAAKKQRKRNNHRLRVLPGVEVSANGTHLLVIFDESKDRRHVDYFLGQLGIPPEHHGKAEFVCPKSVSDVCEIAHRESGITIGAHANSKHGIVGGLQGKPRLAALSAVDLLELNSGFQKADEQVSYVREELGFPDMPFVLSSDAHTPEGVKDNTCFLKMDEPNFVGLQQLIFEPHLRCALGDRPSPQHPEILGISATGGIFGGAMVRFSPELNVVIGGRGAGKSAIIDLLRFALEVSPKQDADVYTKRITSFLKAGESVRVFVRVEGKVYVVSREMEYREEGPRSSRTRSLEGQASVYELSERGELRQDCRPADILKAEVFGQGEVFGLTRRVDEQRRFLDEYVSFSDDEEQAIEELRRGADEIVQLSLEVEELEDKVAKRSAIESRIVELEAHTKEDVFDSHAGWEEEWRFFERGHSRENEARALIESVDLAMKELPPTPSDTPRALLIAAYREIHEKLIQSVIESEDCLKKELAQKANVLEAKREEWQADYDTARRDLRARLLQLGVDELDVVYKELQDKKGELGVILDELVPVLDDRLSALGDARGERRRLLKKLQTQRAVISQKRKEMAEAINADLPGTVRVDVELEADTLEFQSRLDSIYDSSGIRFRAGVWEKLIDGGVTPLLLAEMLTNEATQDLMGYGISADAASKLVSEISPEQLMELECLRIEDVPKISLKKEGEYDFTPLDALSYGERCSAILSIVLLEREGPVIIDQPEEELDHAFITSEIVGTIRRIKAGRQLILCTHNPNIPVLGDAELVIKVRKVPRTSQCAVESAHGLEHPNTIAQLKILEGGEDALQKRSEKYGLRYQDH